MKDKQEILSDIVEEVFKSPELKIELDKKNSINELIKIAVNGDAINEYIVVNVRLKDSVGVNVYILTNAKLLQIEITNHEPKSLAFILNTIISVERKLIDKDWLEIKIVFKDNKIVGLRYSTAETSITDFFQKIEQIWEKKF